MSAGDLNQTTGGEIQIANGKNKHEIYCERCSSVILLAQKANITKKEFYLPHMKKKTDGAAMDGDTLTDYWIVDDMFTFENVGFSNTVNGIKYLICADCEVGPIGWHDITDKNAYYISTTRVTYKNT